MATSTTQSDNQLKIFKQIDLALKEYYERLGHNDYINQNGNGIFLQYVIDEELIDIDLPINKELGDDSNPYDCAYSWINNDTQFPLPTYCILHNNQQKEQFIFYLLQYCYKYGKSPHHQYIQQILIPKCGGSINPTISMNNQQTLPILTTNSFVSFCQRFTRFFGSFLSSLPFSFSLSCYMYLPSFSVCSVKTTWFSIKNLVCFTNFFSFLRKIGSFESYVTKTNHAKILKKKRTFCTY